MKGDLVVSNSLWGKSAVLGRLRGSLRTAVVDEGHVIGRRRGSWRRLEPSDKVILERWVGSKLILRSDAHDEDQPDWSQAGRYQSIVVDETWTFDDIESGINRVFQSYGTPHPGDSVLVQQYVEPSATAVVTTRVPVTGAPYAIVALDSVAASSDGVTSGLGAVSAWYILDGLRPRETNSNGAAGEGDVLKALLATTRELAQHLASPNLLLELLLDRHGQVHVLQARPLPLGLAANIPKEGVVHFVKQAQTSCETLWTRGLVPVMSNTSDWNPAEMLGSRPEVLATSLYKHAITDSVWAIQRVQYGYADQRGTPLMLLVAGHPYIDVASSLRSFVPAGLQAEARARIVDRQLEMISRARHLHTSLEFDVTLSSAQFGLERRLRGWPTDALTSLELDTLRAELSHITLDGISRLSLDLSACAAATRRRRAIHAQRTPHERLIALLNEIGSTAALPFAHLARAAFMAMAFLRSAREEELITAESVDIFLRNIGTVSSRLRNDGHKVHEKRMSWSAFVERYGHLRPGTYDIRELSYGSNPEKYLAPFVVRRTEASDQNRFTLFSSSRSSEIRRNLREIGVPIEMEDLQHFISQAIRARETAKFELSAWVSALLDAALEVGSPFGLGVNELAAFTVSELRTLAIHGTIPEGALIDGRHEEHGLARLTHLPSTIVSGDDLTWFSDPPERATYLGQRTVTGSVNWRPEPGEVLDGIVVVEQADPGWEWLFSQPIQGMVTAQGGPNSHLAVRCAELGIPAAIGVGLHQISALAAARVARLDPVNGRVEVLM